MENVNANPPRLVGKSGTIVLSQRRKSSLGEPAAGQESIPDSLREVTRLPGAKAPTRDLVHDSSQRPTESLVSRRSRWPRRHLLGAQSRMDRHSGRILRVRCRPFPRVFRSPKNHGDLFRDRVRSRSTCRRCDSWKKPAIDTIRRSCHRTRFESASASSASGQSRSRSLAIAG